MKNLYQKINDIMKEVTTVIKDSKVAINSFQSYQAVSHDEVTRSLHLPCANAGLVLATSVIDSKIERLEKTDKNGNIKSEYMASVMIELTVIDSDNPSDKLSVKMPAIAFDSGDKAFGKSISMATKYAYLKLFMLESIDEEESQEHEQKFQQSKPINTAQSTYNKLANKNAPYKIQVGKHQGKLISELSSDEIKSTISGLEAMSDLTPVWLEYLKQLKSFKA